MKTKINLLLILGIPLFMVNCSGKPNYSQRHQVFNPPPIKTPTQNNRPSLGTPISVPRSSQNHTPILSAPTHRQIFRYGESYFSKKFKLPNRVKESSGLIKVDNKLWTFNDSGGKAALYQIDERSGRIVKTFNIQNASNVDWEDIAYDDNYVYIGDFGNNRGNRRDLKVYKIPRASLRTSKRARAEIIHFSYSDQKDFQSKPQHNNYDCEAMIAYHGKLYLFSKNWQNQKSRLYELSTTAGRHKAHYISTFNTQGMVTGASINRELGILLLTTYSPLLSVNIWAFTNFNGTNLFKGDAKKLKFSTPLQGQVEGITFIDNYHAYLSSERFQKYIFSFDALLYTLDFSREFDSY